MPFFRNKEGRPQGTELTEDGLIVHYTCNAPSEDILAKHGIKPAGKAFGIEPREVLIIPVGLMKDRGNPDNTIDVENMLSSLGKK
ncbi:MAG TPA: hypothetical protein PK045_01665 [Candidatus Woesebacteria bacterium]|nr:hypothetical protein [Candidatus Woesebacteria bacterium]